MSKRPRGTGSIFSMPGSRNLWVGYTGPNGEYIRESCGSPKKTDAQKFLKKGMEAVSNGNFLGPRFEKITVDELYDDLLQDYRTHGKDVEWAEGRWDVHLKDHFGVRASRVGPTRIAGYVEKRQKEGAAKATLNRELALLRRAFSIGTMSFQLTIPWRVALPQSPPPLRQPGLIVNQGEVEVQIEKQRTVGSVLTVCLTQGDNPNLPLDVIPSESSPRRAHGIPLLQPNIC